MLKCSCLFTIFVTGTYLSNNCPSFILKSWVISIKKLIITKRIEIIKLTVIVKNIDGENLVWTSEMNTLEDIKNREEYYLNVMQIIMDFEASVLEKCFTWQVNRNKRFDFRENTKCLNSLNDF